MDLHSHLCDLEQQVLGRDSSYVSLLDSIDMALERAEIDPASFDTISNLLNGLRAHINMGSEAFDECLREVFRRHTSAGQGITSGILDVNDDYTLTFPRQVLDMVGWGPKDTLTWAINGDGTCSIRKNEPNTTQGGSRMPL